jgi:LysM repeat protein
MQKRTTYWLIGCVAVLLFASGCFQSAGSSSQAVSGVDNAGATFTPFPSSTPFPTLTPLIITATIDFSQQSLSFPTQALGQGGSIVAEQPTSSIAQPIDPLDMTATVIIGLATSDQALRLTATACALGLCGPTATPFVPGVATAAPIPGSDCIHEVRAEDKNLYRISLRYGVTVDAIVAATTPRILNPDLISIGQRLTIPGCGTTGAIPPATSTPSPVPGGGVIVATTTPFTSGGGATAGTTYIVKQYDTLFSISMQTGVPVQSIANANGIQNINLILIGQTLVIPTQ